MKILKSALALILALGIAFKLNSMDIDEDFDFDPISEAVIDSAACAAWWTFKAGEGVVNLAGATARCLDRGARATAGYVHKLGSRALTGDDNGIKEAKDVLVDLPGKVVVPVLNELGQRADNLNARIDEAKKDMRKYGLAVGGIAALVGAYFIVKKCSSYYQNKNKIPTLVVDHSIKSWYQRIKSKLNNTVNEEYLILSESLENTLSNAVNDINNSTRVNNKDKEVKYKNILLTGKSGIGKKSFAKEISRQVNLPYVIVNCVQLGRPDAWFLLDEFFKWVENKKVVLIIENIDILLDKQSKISPTIISNFLNVIKMLNKSVAIFCAKKHNESINEHLEDIEVVINLTLPENLERYKAIIYYKNLILLNEKNDPSIISSSNEYLDDNKMIEIANKTEGFTFRKLKSLITDIQIAASQSQNKLLTNKLIGKVIAKYIS